MNSALDLAEDLRKHHSLCLEVLALVHQESEALRAGNTSRQFEFHQTRKVLAPRLDESVSRIKAHRARWTQLSAVERAAAPEVPALLRQAQDLIMKIIVLDRENEQLLLRQGLVPPRHLPSVNRQRPHFVADLYRRGGGC
jgi:hypothetical protein